MARVTLKGRRFINGTAARAHETQGALRRTTREIEGKARANLARARSSTRWHKIYGPGHLTHVNATRADGEYGDIDYLVNLEAPNAMAIEFGHQPSGVFGPGGSLGHLDTKAPEGLYILSRAAGLTGR